MERLRFRSFASGSSGNCYFLGNASMGILIDAGIGVRTIRRQLKVLGLDFPKIWGVFITHDHTDHIRAVGNVGEKHNVPIYTTRKIHEGINRNYRVTQKLTPTSQRYLEIGKTIEISDFKITAFPVSHDASESIGYSVEYKEQTFTFATDLGFVSKEAAQHLVQSDYIVIEANYDQDMLLRGFYPEHLKRRVASDHGHLCNDQTADFLTEHFTNRWKNIFLCHLSDKNNTPEIARKTICKKLISMGKNAKNQIEVVPLERKTPSKLYIFE